MISCNNLSKAYISAGSTSTIYDNLNRSVQEAQSISIMGPSGSGKSTLLNLVSGLDIPDKGQVVVGDTIVSDLKEDERTIRRSQHIGFIFQQFLLVPNLTIQDNIDLVIDISQVKRRFSTDDILEKVGLSGYNKRYPHQLSGGEQQRIAIARAFVGQLPILLADEPTGNLDHKNAIMIMDLMKKLQQESKVTSIIITHDPQIADYADISYTLQQGKLITTS